MGKAIRYPRIRPGARAAVFALVVGGCTTDSSEPVVYRTPVLETIVQRYSNALRITPERPDGSYVIGVPRPPGADVGSTAEPYLRIRVQGDVNMKVLVDGAELPRQSAATSESGWYEPSGTVPKSSSRNVFWDIAVELPPRVFADDVREFPVTLAYETFTSVQQPELRITLRLQGRDPAYVSATPRPSEVFVDDTENTKQDNRMETAIVAREVTLAGWLENPFPNDGTFYTVPGAREDWHYNLFLDPDFIERNYATPAVIEPIRRASLPGNVVPLIRGSATPIPLLSSDPTLPTSKPTAATFTLPGNANFVVELNAWHTWSDRRGVDGKTGRGPAPLGWFSDPDPSYAATNAWPFNPTKGIGNATGPDLQAGDYVIVSGTLWEDSPHKDQSRAGRLRTCLDDRFKGHGGWLEIHPVDAVRRVDAPSPRKHVLGFSACYPEEPHVGASLIPPTPPPDNTAQLRYEVIVDTRFTSSNIVHSEAVDTNCEPPRLNVTADVLSPGSYNATYIMWWEKSEAPRTGRAICLPAMDPILGGAAD